MADNVATISCYLQKLATYHQVLFSLLFNLGRLFGKLQI